MGLTNLQAVLVTAFLSLVGMGLKELGYMSYGSVLIWIGILGILSIFGFNGFQAFKRKAAEIIFFDDFSVFEGWMKVLNGRTMHSNERSHSGSCSLKKIDYNDPNGGYKAIGRTLKRGFCLSGWIYRPSDFSGGPADRLAIENSQGNGYGFGVLHGNDTIGIIVERRDEGLPSGILNGVQLNFPGGLTDNWYYFEFQITKAAKIVLRLTQKNQALAHVKTQDSKYTTFDRIAIHGGHSYFVDDLKLIGA